MDECKMVPGEDDSCMLIWFLRFIEFAIIYKLAISFFINFYKFEKNKILISFPSFNFLKNYNIYYLLQNIQQFDISSHHDIIYEHIV